MLIYDSCIILYIYCCKYVLMPVATHGHVPSCLIKRKAAA
jgi:hypothetical protein